MNKITVSAPGKLMLFGEHSVVYNHPCIVTAVSQRMKITLELIDNGLFDLNAEDVDVIRYKKSLSDLGKGNIPKGVRFVEIAVKNFFQKFPLNNGLKITTKSEFSNKYGFGSSSASTACVIKALSELSGNKLSLKEIFDISYKTVLEIQGKASGFDVAASVFGGTLYFLTEGKQIVPISCCSINLVIGYSGIKADTVVLINEVLEKRKKYPEIINGVFNEIEIIVEKAKTIILEKDWQTLGELMNLNQGYLEVLGVGSKKLSDMIYNAREAGAYGAKISGAGIGDCMIALIPEEKRHAVENGIKKAGGEVINIKTSVEGVKIGN